MPSIELWQYSLIALGAFFIGLGKGGLSGIGNLTIVMVALALPAKLSVGVLLPILISADILAVFIYHRHAEWKYIARLAPSMIVGILLGYFVFSRVDDGTVRIMIGVILLSMSSIHLFRKWQRRANQGTDRLHTTSLHHRNGSHRRIRHDDRQCGRTGGRTLFPGIWPSQICLYRDLGLVFLHGERFQDPLHDGLGHPPFRLPSIQRELHGLLGAGRSHCPIYR